MTPIGDLASRGIGDFGRPFSPTHSPIHQFTNPPIHQFPSLSPMALDQIPAPAVVVKPMRRHPARVPSRRTLPSSRPPHVLAAVPGVETGDPDVAGPGRRDTRFDDRR